MINDKINRFLIVVQSNIGRTMERRVQMRKRKWRKLLLGMIFGALLVVQVTTPVLAADAGVDQGIFVDGSWLTEESEAMTEELFDFTIEPLNENVIIPYSLYLYGGSARISNAGDGKVGMYANTKASTICDTVKVDIYLQYYNNGAWDYVNNFNYTIKNESYIARSRTVSVTKGRYYRIKCYHAITKNGVKESCVSVTDGIKIQ